MVQDLCVFGLENSFFFSILLKISREDISNSISFALAIIEPKIILWQLLSLSNLSRAQALYIHEAIEIVMVRKIKDLMFAILEIIPPGLKDLNNY